MSGPLRRRRWWILLACSYLALLIASRAVEPPYERKPGPELEVSSLQAVRGEAIEQETVRLAWRRWSPEAAPGRSIPIRPPSRQPRIAS